MTPPNAERPGAISPVVQDHAAANGNEIGSHNTTRLGRRHLTFDGNPSITPEWHRRLTSPRRGDLAWLAQVDADTAAEHLLELIGPAACSRLADALAHLVGRCDR